MPPLIVCHRGFASLKCGRKESRICFDQLAQERPLRRHHHRTGLILSVRELRPEELPHIPRSQNFQRIKRLAPADAALALRDED